jgi:hypothetical protein
MLTDPALRSKVDTLWDKLWSGGVEEQEEFARLVDRTERVRSIHREALRQAEHLFQTLLHRAFTSGLNRPSPRSTIYACPHRLCSEQGACTMTLAEMNRMVGEELEHIPNWPEPQNMLRMTYAMLRKISLRKKTADVKSRHDVLRESIASVKETNPDWQEQFDCKFFSL